MRSILLISPRVDAGREGHQSPETAREPLGILALGSYLKHNGYHVSILDANLYPETHVRSELERIIAAKPTLVGLSVKTAQLPHALELSKLAKLQGPNTVIVWGGIHPTLFPEQTSLDPHIDFVVYGAGESTCLELAQKLEAGDKDFENVRGIAIKGEKMLSREPEDLDSLPFFDYGLLDLKWYLGPAPHYLLSDQPIHGLNVLSSRGCPWRCGFCINYATKNRWRMLSPERFLDELEYQVKAYDLQAVRILDEDFFVSQKRVTAIVEGLQRRNLRLIWGTNVRANYFSDTYITVDYAKSLAEAGVKFLTLGAESGSDRVLKLLHKDVTVEQTLRSAEVCAKAGIIPLYSWMIGIPGQTKAEMRTNIELMDKINAVCPSAMHTTNWVFRPFPGGDLYDACREMGMHEPGSVEEWAQMGTDRERNTGSFAVSQLPWIEEADFVEFLSTFTPSIRMGTGPQTIPGFLLSQIVRLLYRTWDWPVLGWFSRSIGNSVRMIVPKLTSN